MCTYNIDYNDYNANLCSGLQYMLASAEMSDVTLAVEGEYFMAHQVILSMFSSYFRDLFNARPSKNTIFFMMNVKHRIMKCILAFIYEGKVEIQSDDFQLFVETAKELKIKGLSDTDLQTMEAPIELVNTSQDIAQVNNDSIIMPSLKRSSDTTEHHAKKSKTDHVIPIISEISVFPYNRAHSGDLEIEATEQSDMVNPDIFDIGPTEILGLNDDTIELDDDKTSISREIEASAGVSLMEMACEPIDQSNDGEPVPVSLCLSEVTNKVTGVIWDGFRYKNKGRRGSYSRWRCSANGTHKCDALLLWSDDGLIAASEHNHPRLRGYHQASVTLVSRTLYAVSFDYFLKHFDKAAIDK